MRNLTSGNRGTRRIAVTLRVHRELLWMDYLRRRTAMPENVDRNFLECLRPSIDGAVDTIGRFDPIDLAGAQLGVNGRASVTKFHRQGVAAEDNRYAMPGVAVPRASLAGREAHASNQRRSASVQDFLVNDANPYRRLTRSAAYRGRNSCQVRAGRRMFPHPHHTSQVLTLHPFSGAYRKSIRQLPRSFLDLAQTPSIIDPCFVAPTNRHVHRRQRTRAAQGPDQQELRSWNSGFPLRRIPPSGAARGARHSRIAR